MQRVAIVILAAVLAAAVQVPHADGLVDASCHVSVHINQNTSTVQVDGKELARQNPDGTYYPGDAFDFGIMISWTHSCTSVRPQQIKSSGIVLGQMQEGPVSYDKDGGHYYEYGHAEIGTSAGSASLSQVVDAIGLVCGRSGCTRGHVSASDSYMAAIIRPEVTVSLGIENLTDRDGYAMRNMDGTYYVWDAINILFEPHYKWKEERLGTVDASTDSVSDIVLVAKYECHKASCQHVFSDGAVTPWSHNFGYEGGNTVYNATSLGDARIHTFQYHTVIYNLGHEIGEGHNSTTALVVRYNPVYASYPYTVLKETGSWWGFGKSPAVALHYYGSAGGGQDDDQSVHQDRRSKINSFEYSSFAYRVLEPVALNESLAWSGAYPSSFVDGNFSYRDDSLQPGKNSAMFLHAGYGKIVFSHPILHTILKTRYDNSTIINTLQSANFAGCGACNLTRYVFGYPHTKFSTSVVVVSLHSDGSINRIPLGIEMVPDSVENATYEQDFVRDKVAHDRDRIFAGIILDDMYGKKDSAAGLGLVNMRANLTSMAMPDIYRVLWGDPLGIPLNVVYEQPSPYNVTITAGQKRLSFIERSFEFDTNWRYVVNTDQDNVLNATRYGGLVRIGPDNNFGPYAKIVVDGNSWNGTCNYGCTLLLRDGDSNATISAYNVWGGRASVTLVPGNHTAAHYGYGTAVAALVVMVSSVIGYGLVRKYWRGFTALLGSE